MKIVTAEEMREIDRKTINTFSISGRMLMERAGLAVSVKIKELFSRRNIIVVSGSGNNGGDGLVIARNLHNEGWNVLVFLTSRPEDLKADALEQYKTAAQAGVSVHAAEELSDHYATIFSGHTLVVDALVGTGLSKNISGSLSELISLINRSAKPVISVDIPSGISSDNGQVLGTAVKADYTVTFGLPKRGHLLYPGAEFTGRLFIEDIGFPQELLYSETLKVELLEKNNVSRLIPGRYNYSHKGDYGHVLLIAGSRGKTGAALMAAKACLRTGAGLVTIGVPESLSDIFQSCVAEEMTLMLPDQGNGELSSRASDNILEFLEKTGDILAIGPGIGVSPETGKLVKTLIVNAGTPIVIDADGINSLMGEKKILSKARVPVILTPHTGEMARLISKRQKTKGKEITTTPKTIRVSVRDDIEKDRIDAAISFAKDTGTYLVLKGVPTVIAAPDGNAFVNSTGNPGMASAGTGDVLTGMIAGFWGQCRKPLDSCILGVYLHGVAGDIAAHEKGQHSLIATDIIDKIPSAFFSLR